MLLPYNDFFKVGVASSGNHDNNIYNANWSESNHGLKMVPAKKDTSARGRRAGSVAAGGARGGGSDTAFVADSTFEIQCPPTSIWRRT